MPSLSHYMRGSRVVVTAEFRVPDSKGSLTNPTTVTFTARLRGETATAYVYGTDPEVTRPSIGVYELEYEPAEGVWAVHVQGTGTAHAADEIEFVIDHSRALA